MPGLVHVDGDPLRLAIPRADIEPELLLRAALDHDARVVGLASVEPTMRELFVREVQAA